MFKLDTLNNGITLLTAPLKETQAVTVLVLVKVGSRYEPLKLNGISHFIEHLLFKGTGKRPTSLDITKELDGVGADYNAFTAKDHTGYYVKVEKEHLKLALDIVADMLFNPLFPKAEMEKERGVIIEEINMYEDNPLMLIGDIFESCIFSGHALGQRISGPKQNIKNLKQETIVDFYQKHYLNRRLLVGIGGNFPAQDIKKIVNQYFGAKRLAGQKRPFSKFVLKQRQPKANLHYKDTSQAQLALGLPAFKNTDPRFYPLTLLAVILGGNMSSRLFLEIREKRGLAYFVRAGVNLYEDPGAFLVQAGLEKSRIFEAVKVIREELEKAREKGVTAEELKRAKEFIKGKLVLQLEDSASLISWLGEQRLLADKVESAETKLKKINAVTLEDVKKVAQQIFDFKKINLGLIGPFKEKSRFLNIFKN